MKVLQAAGFKTAVLGNRRYDFLRYFWLAGNTTVFEGSDFNTVGYSEWVDRQVNTLTTLKEWLALEYQGVRVGRFVVASNLRGLRRGRLEFTDDFVKGQMRRGLEGAVRGTRAVQGLFAHLKPHAWS